MADLVTPLARRSLEHHPQTPSRAVDEVTVEVGVQTGNTLVVRWRIAGDIDELRVPELGARLDPDRLWAHTCCELFAMPAAGEAYVEWNFSPSGQVAQFEFEGYRRRAPASPLRPVASSSVSVAAGALLLEARAALPPDIGDSLRISITAVVEDAAGALSYWALRHPCDRPDFHDPGGFALALTLGAAPAIVHP